MVSPLGQLEVKLAQLPGLHLDAVGYRRGDWLKLGGGVNQLIADLATDQGYGAAYYMPSMSGSKIRFARFKSL